jgi:hypothetical protein
MAWWGIDDLIVGEGPIRHVQVMRSYLPFALLITAGGLALLTKSRWLELTAFALCFLVAIWAVGMWGLGRYTASCWPAFLPLGVGLARIPWLQGPIIALLALFQGLFFFLFSHQYMIL